MKMMFRSGTLAFEPYKSGLRAYIFDDEGNYLTTPMTAEDGLDALSAFITALTPSIEGIEKELMERIENLKRDIKFYDEHKWNVAEKEAELKTIESKLTAIRSVKENIKSLNDFVEAYFKT